MPGRRRQGHEDDGQAEPRRPGLRARAAQVEPGHPRPQGPARQRRPADGAVPLPPVADAGAEGLRRRVQRTAASSRSTRRRPTARHRPTWPTCGPMPRCCAPSTPPSTASGTSRQERIDKLLGFEADDQQRTTTRAKSTCATTGRSTAASCRTGSRCGTATTTYGVLTVKCIQAGGRSESAHSDFALARYTRARMQRPPDGNRGYSR